MLILQGTGTDGPIPIIFGVLGCLVLLGVMGFLVRYGLIYVKSILAGAPVSVVELLGMRLRGVPPGLIVDCYIMAVKAGLDVEAAALEMHHLASGNVSNVVRALIAASNAGIPLTFNDACALDLAGHDVTEVVRAALTPRVLEWPNSEGAATVQTRDGSSVEVEARLTVRTNLATFVGGVTENFVAERTGEHLVDYIADAEAADDVIEDPEAVSAAVMEMRPDAGSTIEIVSIELFLRRTRGSLSEMEA